MNRVNDECAHVEFGTTDVSAAYVPAEQPPTAFILRVVEGPDVGRFFTIDEATASPVLVGQSPACALRLTDPEVSRRHAAFELAKHRLRLVDLQSTNGSHVAGLAVTDVFLSGGELVRIGTT